MLENACFRSHRAHNALRAYDGTQMDKLPVTRADGGGETGMMHLRPCIRPGFLVSLSFSSVESDEMMIVICTLRGHMCDILCVFSLFLDATKHLYKRVCLSVRPSVR